jgi:hypothetical protein
MALAFTTSVPNKTCYSFVYKEGVVIMGCDKFYNSLFANLSPFSIAMRQCRTIQAITHKLQTLKMLITAFQICVQIHVSRLNNISTGKRTEATHLTKIQ